MKRTNNVQGRVGHGTADLRSLSYGCGRRFRCHLDSFQTLLCRAIGLVVYVLRFVQAINILSNNPTKMRFEIHKEAAKSAKQGRGQRRGSVQLAPSGKIRVGPPRTFRKLKRSCTSCCVPSSFSIPAHEVIKVHQCSQSCNSR
jgi:hypothetical protein